MRRLCLYFLILALLLVLVGCPELFDKPTDDQPQGFVLVQGGTFWMGDEHEDLHHWFRPAHKVTLTYNFWMGEYLVTFAEYDAFITDTGRPEPDDEGWGRGRRPAINVSWWDAIAYCNWLSDNEGLPEAYDDEGNFLDGYGEITDDPSEVVGYRLPTEAEWEYAARGGKNSPPYKYSGSDTVELVAWYEGNSGGHTRPVGLQRSNAFGIFDMSGNVYEWCSDGWYDYVDEPKTNPYVRNGSFRMLRGGCWNSDETSVRVAARIFDTPDKAYNNGGFRITRTAP